MSISTFECLPTSQFPHPSNVCTGPYFSGQCICSVNYLCPTFVPNTFNTFTLGPNEDADCCHTGVPPNPHYFDYPNTLTVSTIP
jgi:hypothetical protein